MQKREFFAVYFQFCTLLFTFVSFNFVATHTRYIFEIQIHDYKFALIYIAAYLTILLLLQLVVCTKLMEHLIPNVLLILLGWCLFIYFVLTYLHYNRFVTVDWLEIGNINSGTAKEMHYLKRSGNVTKMILPLFLTSLYLSMEGVYQQINSVKHRI